jgi:hypothetical protein
LRVRVHGGVPDAALLPFSSSGWTTTSGGLTAVISKKRPPRSSSACPAQRNDSYLHAPPREPGQGRSLTYTECSTLRLYPRRAYIDRGDRRGSRSRSDERFRGRRTTCVSSPLRSLGAAQGLPPLRYRIPQTGITHQREREQSRDRRQPPVDRRHRILIDAAPAERYRVWAAGPARHPRHCHGRDSAGAGISASCSP